MTGHAPDTGRHHAAATPLLQKPFRLDELARSVRNALDGVL